MLPFDCHCCLGEDWDGTLVGGHWGRGDIVACDVSAFASALYRDLLNQPTSGSSSLICTPYE
jgi:hypothetical protein